MAAKRGGERAGARDGAGLGDELEAALARAGDGAFVVRGDGRIAFWNRAAEHILGYAARDVVGRSCCDVFAGRDEHGNLVCFPGCAVMSLVKIGEPVRSFDMQTRAKGGRPVWLNVTVLVHGEGEGRATVHLFRDVTATRALVTLVHERLAELRAGTPEPPPPGAAELTRRELEVLRLMADGVSTAAAADRLRVSRATVRNHVQHILAKLDAHSRLEAVARATRAGLLPSRRSPRY